VRFTVFDDNNTPQMRNGRVTALCEGPEGALWIGHETGDLTRYSRGRFEKVEVPTKLAGGEDPQPHHRRRRGSLVAETKPACWCAGAMASC